MPFGAAPIALAYSAGIRSRLSRLLHKSVQLIDAIFWSELLQGELSIPVCIVAIVHCLRLTLFVLSLQVT